MINTLKTYSGIGVLEYRKLYFGIDIPKEHLILEYLFRNRGA